MVETRRLAGLRGELTATGLTFLDHHHGVVRVDRFSGPRGVRIANMPFAALGYRSSEESGLFASFIAWPRGPCKLHFQRPSAQHFRDMPMPCVNYVSFDGDVQTVDVASGENVMRGAVYSGVEGIVGECGGGLACATCHCYVDVLWLDQLPPATDDERAMLEGAAQSQQPNSRLSCQIVMTAALEGLTVHMPKQQY
ncbi:2Fe-2S iron-sulfur cluster-binding protein [Caulobacter sp. LARHSG274]